MEKRANKTITLRIKDETKKKMAMKSHRDTAPGDETVGRHEESDVGGEDEEGGGDVQLQQSNFKISIFSQTCERNWLIMRARLSFSFRPGIAASLSSSKANSPKKIHNSHL